MARTTVGYFHDRGSADAAFDDLVKNGFSRDAISIMGRGREGGTGLADDDHAGAGAGEGAAVGGIAGLLSARRRCSSPGSVRSSRLVRWPQAWRAVTGGVTGAVVGGIVGGLEEAGVPHEDARYYDERFQKGGYLLTVRADDMEYDKARMIMERHDGDVRAGNASGATAATAATGTRTAAGWDTAMPGYRSRWEQRHGKSGERWEDFEPAYRYGYEMHANPTSRGRVLVPASPSCARDWEPLPRPPLGPLRQPRPRHLGRRRAEHAAQGGAAARGEGDRQGWRGRAAQGSRDRAEEHGRTVTHEEVVVERRQVEGRRPRRATSAKARRFA